jgi:D-amino peptidase
MLYNTATPCLYLVKNKQKKGTAMKKIYIHTDHEGISGVGRSEMMRRHDSEYRYAIERLMADTNAAIDGAFLGGATHVTVVDCHEGGGNFDLDLLDKRAEFDTREKGAWPYKCDETYFGTFFIGAHAMAGTAKGFYDHTQSSQSVYNYYINNRKVGELGQWAVTCAHFGVPLIMMSGDEAAVHEATQFFGDIETAEVKKGTGFHTARLIPDAEAEERIRQAAKRAVEKEEPVAPFRPLLPMEIKIEYTRSEYADQAANKPGVERLDARTVRKIVHSYLEFWF